MALDDGSPTVLNIQQFVSNIMESWALFLGAGGIGGVPLDSHDNGIFAFFCLKSANVFSCFQSGLQISDWQGVFRC